MGYLIMLYVSGVRFIIYLIKACTIEERVDILSIYVIKSSILLGPATYNGGVK